MLGVDVGGSHVKAKLSTSDEERRFDSGPKLTAQQMVDGLRELTSDWDYDVISIGIPAPVRKGQVQSEPVNLGPGWAGFDFERAFGKPTKVVNDAAMQALGSYEGGKMLFLGLGTGLGTALIDGQAVEPLEVQHLPFRKATFEDYVGERGRERLGKKHWRKAVAETVELLSKALESDYVVLGGGNAKQLKELPPNTPPGRERERLPRRVPPLGRRHARRSERAGMLEAVTRELAIRLRGAVKRYGPITAVDGLDLDVPVGTCVGLLGPNGAGKSTTMRMLTAQAIADEGELEVLGYRLPQDSKQARAQCGVVPQLDNLDVSLTVEQNLLVFTHLYRIGRHDRQAAIERSLELANLADRRDTRVDKLSGGMRRRLLIARALVHQPRLVLMDEPTVGLDPQVRQQLWALIDRLRHEGTTILMSTHYIEEAERLADTVLIMSHGEGVARGKPADLVLEYAGREVLEVYGPPKRLAEVESEATASGLKTRRTGTSVSILGLDGRNGFGFDGERRQATLEDVFVLLTGEEIA